MNTNILIGIMVAIVLTVVGVSVYLNKTVSVQQTYQTATPAPSIQTTPPIGYYTNALLGFSIQAEGFTVNDKYIYQGFGPKNSIHGVQFIIPKTLVTGTNLNPDSYISVEQLPEAQTCDANAFLAQHTVQPSVSKNNATYSVATSTDAAAGNRYEETVYAITGSTPCTAIRYFIHYSAIENYPAGTIKQFNKQELISKFETIRDSLTLSQ
jgi:hypothetical protein